MDRGAIATWTGTSKEGDGVLNTDAGALVNTPYASKSRFEQEDDPTGTNPEELLAAALAGSYTMALAQRLTELGHPAHRIRTEVRVQCIKPGGSWTIGAIRVHTTAHAPGLDPSRFLAVAAEARQHCVIASALRPEISLTASLA